MTRLAARSPRFDRHAFDWYVEPRWAVEALFDTVPMLGTVADPACGMGTIPEVARDRGHEIIATDIVDRDYAHLTTVADFLADPAPFADVENIVTNPPYSYRPGSAEAFTRRALAIATQTVAVLVPLRWLSSEVRFTLFSQFTPYQILHFSERPSMPPGNKIAELGRRAFRGGAIDYCWIVWKLGYHGASSTVWIPPRPRAAR